MPKKHHAATVITKILSNKARLELFNSHIGHVVELRKSGMSTYKISEQTGIAAETLKRWLKKVGEYNPEWSKVSQEQIASIREMYMDGLPIPSIALRIGVHSSTVQNITMRIGVRRTRSESQVVRAARDPSVGKMYGNPCAFYSIKQAKWFYAGSGYEYVRMEILDSDDDVVMWRRCEDRIPYEMDGLQRLYLPDLEVIRKNGSVTIEEIKPKKLTETARNTAKFAAARLFYAALGKRFILVTEDDIGGKDATRRLDGNCLSGMPVDERLARRKATVAKHLAGILPDDANKKSAIYRANKKKAMAERYAALPESEKPLYYPCGVKR